MAERTILGILILLSLCQTYAGLEVFAPSPQRAFVTNDTVLNCTFLLDKQPLDLNFLAILWSFQGKVILRYDNKGFFTEDPRMSLNVESLGDGYASLHISNVTVYHRGTYMCTVIYSPESKEKEILFEALARPVLSILNTKVQRNTENTLTCKATGFFPPEIKFTWYRDKDVLKKQLMEKPQEYENGTYQVTSTVTITPTDDDQNKISCKVQHDSLQEPLQWNFQLIYEETSYVITVVCILVVMAIISVGIGICLWMRKYRKKDMGTFTVMDILPNPTKLIAGEETSLNCKATNCPENTSVTWLEKRGGQVYEIPEYHGGDKEEEERLMDTQYGVISCREGPNFTSSLKFRPSVTNHKDVTFICRYSCGEEKEEKTFHCKTIYAKPQLLQPVSRSLIVSGELKYFITLEKFYPRNITIRWAHGVGEPQQALPSTETIRDIPDGTYNVCSEVKIPEELLKNPESKVRVSWKHETLENLGYKDLSIRDSEYPWIPVMEEIQTPIVLHDTPATLQCHISKYFPNTITVTWLRKIKNQELCEETDKNTITPRREADNTYSCRASLTIVPTLSVHQGAEYICRVDHPSLERPIEKTKSLIVMVKPQMVEPIEITMGDSSLILFTLNLQKFYPENIEIKWRYEYKEKKSKMPWDNNSKKYEDLTHGVTSVGHIPMYVFDDLQTKVSVTWKHESMEEPETRTLTIRDLPWCPKVGEITIPKLEEDKKESCLTCNISGYFLNHLKVSWFKKEAGTDLQDNVAPVSKDTYKVSNEKELKDKTSYKSSLIFTPSFGRDQGAEFICSVEHPSLEHPIERRTGPIRIDLPRPQVGEIKIPILEEDKKATLTCDISGSFPKYINVSWYRKEPGIDSHPSITPLPNDTFKIHTKKIDKDKTCQSSLTFTPSLSRDKGAEFICKVEYPSLKQPVEKSTGPIKLTTHSVNGTVKAQQKASSRQSKLDKSHKV